MTPAQIDRLIVSLRAISAFLPGLGAQRSADTVSAAADELARREAGTTEAA